jgi:hypothetical protein
MSRLLELESRFDTHELLISGTETYPHYIHVHGLQCQPDVAGLYSLDAIFLEDDSPMYKKIIPDGDIGYLFWYEPESYYSGTICGDGKNHWRFLTTTFNYVDSYAVSDALNPLLVTTWVAQCSESTACVILHFHTLLLARAPLLLATLLSHTSLFPRVH